MHKWQVMLVTLVLGVAVSAGHAAAGVGEEYGARKVGTVSFIDRQANLIQLADGTELHATDAGMLQNISEGMRVVVDFAHSDDDRNELNSIEPVGAGTPVSEGASPTAG
jgi:hypothetical protein